MHCSRFKRLRQFGFALLVLVSDHAAARTWPSYRLLAGQLEGTHANGPVLVQFWASWCQSCAGLTTDIAALLGSSTVVQHIAVSVDHDLQEARTASARISQLAGPAATILLESQGSWSRKFDVSGVPAIVLLDTEGEVRLKLAGHPSSRELRQLADALETVSANRSVAGHE